MTEICDKCGKIIKDDEMKVILDDEFEGIYHQRCSDKILGIETR